MNKNTKINFELIATITGFTYSEKKVEATNAKGEKYKKTDLDSDGNPIPDFSNVQIQSQFKDADGVEQKYTLKLKCETKFEQMKALRGKTFKFTGAKETEISSDDGKFKNTYYSATGIGEEIKGSEKVFIAKKTLTAVLSTIIEKEQKDKNKNIIGHNTIFQITSETETPFGIKSDLKNITLKGEKADKFKALVGKKVHFDNIRITSFGGKVYFSIESAPSEVK